MQADYARRYRVLWERHWWWRSREAHVLAWIERLQRRSPIARILDVGCGDGLFFERLERFGRVEGLEPDASLIQDPRWRSQIRVGSLEAGEAPRGPFDLLLLLDVLEHIEDDRGALDQARSALRPGGSLLLTVPALSGLWSRHDEANQHHRRYGRSILRGRLIEAGFEVESLRYYFAWTVLPLLARRWLAPAGSGVLEHAVPIPPGPVNRALERFSRAEHAVGRVIPWPLGTSLLAVARRPSEGVPARAAARFSRGGRLLSGRFSGE